MWTLQAHNKQPFQPKFSEKTKLPPKKNLAHKETFKKEIQRQITTPWKVRGAQGAVEREEDKYKN